MRSCVACGQLLSRYNPAERCHACTRATPSSAGVEVPPELLFRLDVRRALADWDWSTVLRVISRETGASQSAIATATGLSQPHVSRLMNGRSQEPGIRTVRALCDGLGIPRGLAGLGPIPIEDVEEETTERRDFLTGSLGAAVLAVAPVLDATPRHIGHADVEQLFAAARELQRLDRLHGADPLCEVAVRFLRRADEWLNFARYPAGIGPELQVAYGTLAHVTGWLHYDANRQAAARHYYREALGAAQLAGDAELEVRVLNAMSMQATHLGRPREAIQLGHRARERAAGWATPRLKALLLMREATGWAASGDESASRRAQVAASNVFNPTPDGDDPEWIGFFDEAEFTGLKAGTLSHLELPERAVPVLMRATALRSAQGTRRNQLWFRAFLAEQQIRQGDVDGACRTLEDNIEAITEITSTRIRSRVAGVCRTLVRIPRPRTRELAERARRLGVSSA